MRVLITGSSGLVGSAVAEHFDGLGCDVIGVDNNGRADFFGPAGDTATNRARLVASLRSFTSVDVDVRDRGALDALIAAHAPIDIVVHCAAQPSHDLAAARPFDDFDVNAVGTLNLLEAVRRHSMDATFVFLSTNKVYGDRPNQLALEELKTRWDYSDPADYTGIDETMPIDQSLHSLFGAGKASADLLVQEYGRYFRHEHRLLSVRLPDWTTPRRCAAPRLLVLPRDKPTGIGGVHSAWLQRQASARQPPRR